MRIHAIIVALNEEDFITECLRPIYQYCSGISVVTQYDRNWYGDPIVPDSTVNRILSFPDPEGKINLVIRRHVDEAVARNNEMQSVLQAGKISVIPHARTRAELESKYLPPDYFLIVDADEIFDTETFPNIVEHLNRVRPKVMNLVGFEYSRTWNDRVDPTRYVNHRIGFLRANRFFKARRVHSLWHIRLATYLKRLGLPAKWMLESFGIADCPIEIGVFHHGALLKSLDNLKVRAQNHSEKLDYPQIMQYEKTRMQDTQQIATAELPINIQNGVWPSEFFSARTR